VPPCKRILILTDGYTGKPHPENMRKMRERGIRIYAVMPGESAHQADLQDATRSITVLPPVRRR
jgi:hypothetical protein